MTEHFSTRKWRSEQTGQWGTSFRNKTGQKRGTGIRTGTKSVWGGGQNKGNLTSAFTLIPLDYLNNYYFPAKKKSTLLVSRLRTSLLQGVDISSEMFFERLDEMNSLTILDIIV